MTVRQAQGWTVPVHHRGEPRHSVINEKKHKLKLISSRGIREDAAQILLALVVVVLAALLLLDLYALQDSSARAGELASSVSMLEQANADLAGRLNTSRSAVVVNPASSELVKTEDIPVIPLTVR